MSLLKNTNEGKAELYIYIYKPTYENLLNNVSYDNNFVNNVRWSDFSNTNGNTLFYKHKENHRETNKLASLDLLQFTISSNLLRHQNRMFPCITLYKRCLHLFYFAYVKKPHYKWWYAYLLTSSFSTDCSDELWVNDDERVSSTCISHSFSSCLDFFMLFTFLWSPDFSFASNDLEIVF